MASSDDLQMLVDFGLLNEDGVSKLANLIRGVQMLSGGGGMGGGGRGPGKRRGRPPMAKGSMNGSGGGKRGPRATFTATKDELSKLRSAGHTAKAIAAKYGVSMATVNLHLRKHGLTNPRKGKPAKAAKK